MDEEERGRPRLDGAIGRDRRLSRPLSGRDYVRLGRRARALDARDARRGVVRLADWQSKKHKWPLERAVWRAGELRISAAALLLMNLIGSKDALRDYCIAWSLGWCGDASAVASLTRLLDDSKTADFVRRIATEALLKLSGEETRAEFKADMIEKLPAELRELARRGSAKDFPIALKAYLEGGDHFRIALHRIGHGRSRA